MNSDMSSLYRLGKALYETSISTTQASSNTPASVPQRPSPLSKRDRTDSLKLMLQPPSSQRSKPSPVRAKANKLVKDAPPPREKSNPRRWTKEEDDLLRAAVERSGERNWKAIADQVAGRNHTQCLQRWTKVLKPGLIKGHWTTEEDKKLRFLVAEGRKNWGQVAAQIPGRTSKQCRERWCNHLDPNINKGSYTAQEDKIILDMQSKLGNRWSIIAQSLPGRTEDAVKIRWKSLMRTRKTREGTPPDTPTSKKKKSPVNNSKSRPSAVRMTKSPKSSPPPPQSSLFAKAPCAEDVLVARPVTLSQRKRSNSLVTPKTEWGAAPTTLSEKLVSNGEPDNLLQKQQLRLLLREKEKGKLISSSTTSAPSPGQMFLTKQLADAQQRQRQQVILETGWKTAAALASQNKLKKELDTELFDLPSNEYTE